MLGGLVAHLEPAVVEQLLALIGRDPRQMTVPELNALGHEKQPLLRVIRSNCIECCDGSEAEVRRCRMHWCPFWPYRMASNPFAALRSEAQLAHARNRGAALRKATSLEHKTGELALVDDSCGDLHRTGRAFGGQVCMRPCVQAKAVSIGFPHLLPR